MCMQLPRHGDSMKGAGWGAYQPLAGRGAGGLRLRLRLGELLMVQPLGRRCARGR
jgi:hypothetical protein